MVFMQRHESNYAMEIQQIIQNKTRRKCEIATDIREDKRSCAKIKKSG
jgi:hypothetical protein